MISNKKMPRTEPETIDELVAILAQLLDGLTIEKVERDVNLGEDEVADMVVQVRRGGLRRRLLIEVRTLGEPRLAAQAITKLRGLQGLARDGIPVFAARYVSESSRRICKAVGVGYIDLVGNVFLQFGAVLIDREAGASLGLERRGVKQLTAPKATRVVRALLDSPKVPVRITDLARRCSMTPGGVYQVVRLLEDKGYIERDSTKRVRLVKPGELLDAWAGLWSIQRNTIATYFSLERTPGAIMESVARVGGRGKRDYAFTMMAGAYLVAPFVRFVDVWFYITGDTAWWVRELDLRPVEAGGNVHLVIPYDEGVLMDRHEVEGAWVVSDVQLYVDLYNYPARGREQAQFLREKRIRF
jgi:hypothetical protein